MLACIATMIAGVASASANPARAAEDDRGGEPAPAPARADATARPNAVYAELFGKGGAWGLGYERHLTNRIAVGAVVSYAPLDGQRKLVASPYVEAALVGTGHHRWFADVGPQVIYLQTPSPVPEWTGTSSTGIGAQVATGYEYRDHVLVRAYGEAVVGKGGLAPWLGLSIGWTW